MSFVVRFFQSKEHVYHVKTGYVIVFFYLA